MTTTTSLFEELFGEPPTRREKADREGLARRAAAYRDSNQMRGREHSRKYGPWVTPARWWAEDDGN